jgi:hypothetical protein
MSGSSGTPSKVCQTVTSRQRQRNRTPCGAICNTHVSDNDKTQAYTTWLGRAGLPSLFLPGGLVSRSRKISSYGQRESTHALAIISLLVVRRALHSSGAARRRCFEQRDGKTSRLFGHVLLTSASFFFPVWRVALSRWLSGGETPCSPFHRQPPYYAHLRAATEPGGKCIKHTGGDPPVEPKVLPSLHTASPKII